MKYLVTLGAGFVTGAILFLAGIYFNPFTGQPTVSPLAVTDDRIVSLSFSAVPSDGLLYSDHGDSAVEPHPDRVAELWEPAIVDTSIFVTKLESSRGSTTGIGIKVLSRSESTALISGKAIANSIWHVYLPGQGTMLIDQTENYWSYIRDVVIPAKWSAGDSWRGNFFRVTTNGPGSLGTARVTGGGGIFSGVTSESVESLSADGYSGVSGPVSMDGSLTVAMPQQVVAED